MKKQLFLFLAALLTLSPFCSEGKNEWTSYIKMLKNELGDYSPSKEDFDNVRETKIFQDSYLHIYQTTIDGKGKMVKRYKWWPDTEKTINFSMSAKAMLREKITSTKEELAKGIVKSEFMVMKFSERLGVCNAGVSFGVINSQDVLKGLAAWGKFIKKNQKTITKWTSEVISGAKDMLSSKDEKEQQAAIAVLAVACGVEFASRFSGWLFGDVLSKNIDEEGNYILDGDYVKKIYPGFKQVLVKLRNLEGTKVKTVWEYGKGYTKIDIATHLSEVKEEDKELIAKMIYRTNPVGARHFLPKNKENAKKWTVKADEFASLLSVCGIDFDQLEGEVRVRNRGTKYRKDYPDEKAFGRTEVPVVTLDIDQNYPNLIMFAKKLKNNNDLNIKLIPHGKILIATAKDGETNVPTYVREIPCEGDLKNVLRKHINKSSMLKYVDMEESSVSIQGNYQQIRLRDIER